MDSVRFTDVLILGGGVAALRAAVAAASNGTKVTVLVKGPTCSQGLLGYNACVPETGDTPAKFFNDVMVAGEFINNPRLVALLAANSYPETEYLESIGASMRKADGSFKPRLASGSNIPRTVYYTDETAQIIFGALSKQLSRLGVDVISRQFAVELLKDEGRIAGAVAVDETRSELVTYLAKAVILATGGVGSIYSFTSNPRRLTGDGYAMAYETGAELIDMEFTQFEPFIMVHPASCRGFGIATTLLGDGAIAVNRNGEQFLPKYAERCRGVPKDVLSRSIYRELKAGRGTPNGGVFFDTRPVNPDVLSNYRRFVRKCERTGIDPSSAPIEIAPAYHHMMGGVRINERCETRIPGLFAAGEVSGGVQGANRIAGNAGTEVLVFGAAAGRSAAQCAAGVERLAGRRLAEDALLRFKSATEQTEKENGDSETVRTLFSQLQTTMWEKVGIVRNAGELRSAVAEIEELQERAASMGARNLAEWVRRFELRNAALVAQLIARGALIREESRGAHYREDFPARDDVNWLCNLTASRSPDGGGQQLRATAIGGTA